MYIWPLLLLVSILQGDQSGSGSATSPPPCISSHFHELRQHSTGYRGEMLRAEQQYREHMLSPAQRGPKSFSIPVVVYVIGAPGSPVISPTDAEIVAGLDRLNAAFDGLDPCSGTTISGAATGIRFCLATRDIYGAGTTGIVRSTHPQHRVDLCTSETALKQSVRTGQDRFPHADYLNLYVVTEITASCMPDGDAVAGFAAYPAAHGMPTDGIVTEASVFASGSCDLVKVLIHEAGHYLNLLHTFEGGCKNDDCLSDGDRVCDTPPDNDKDIYPSHPCLTGGSVNSCSTDVNPGDPNNPLSSDRDDLSDNYMDYTPPACARSFTSGQAERMHAAIEGSRATLTVSQGCLPPCAQPLDFTVGVWPDSITAGETLSVLVSGPSVSSAWYWTLGTDIFASPHLLWPAEIPGTYVFVLHALHGQQGCSRTDTFHITVYCPLTAEYAISDLTPLPGDTILLTYRAVPGIQYTWYVDGLWLGTADTLAWIPPTAGTYHISLAVCDGTCCTEIVEYLRAGDCPTGLEGALWIFSVVGGIVLDFRDGSPVELPPVGISSNEASIVVCNADGDLLFYSEGRSVYNKNHTIMNPGSQRLWGNNSSTQIMALPVPGEPALYYLFYNTSEHGDFWGFNDDTTSLYYAVIDMRMNGGLGGVAQRNLLMARGVTEKLAATPHCNGRDWWLLSYQYSTDSFLAWLIDAEGIYPPVVSQTGIGVHSDQPSREGELDFSPDGTLLAMATPCVVPGINGSLEIFRFDPVTGIVSDPVLVRNESTFYYGLEFSPDNSLLYAQFNLFTGISQFSLEHYHPDSIRDSEIVLDPGASSYLGMQTGRDGKIYIANYPHPSLSVIHRPNVRGPGCLLDFEGFSLMYGYCFVGLPSLPNGIYTPEKPYLHGPRRICDSLDMVQYYVAGNCVPRDQEWTLLGSSRITAQHGDTLWLTPQAPGMDTLILTRHTPCRSVSDTLIFKVLPCTVTDCAPDFQWIRADTLLCPGEDLVLRFSTTATQVSLQNASGQTLAGATGSTLTLTPPPPAGDYALYLWQETGCDTVVSFAVRHSPGIGFRWLQYDSIVCAGDAAVIDFRSEATRADLLHDDGSWIAMDPALPMTVGPLLRDSAFVIRLRHDAWECDSTVHVSITTEIDGPVSQDTMMLCQGDSLLLWDDWVETAGEYLRVYPRQGCDSVSAVTVLTTPAPEILDVLITDAQCGSPSGQIEVVTAGSDLEYSLDGISFSASPLFTGVMPGIYLIVLRNAAGCTTRADALVVATGAPQVHDIHIVAPRCGTSDGSISITATGTGPLTYALDGSVPTAIPFFSGLAPGAYVIIVTDSTGCTATEEILLSTTDGPVIDDVLTMPAHCKMADGQLTVIASPADGLMYSLDGGNASASPVFTGLFPGDYTITVSDTLGCTAEVSVHIDEIPPVQILALNTEHATCGDPNGRIIVTAAQTDDVFYSIDRISWQDSPEFDLLDGGVYTAYLLSYGACIDSAVAEIIQHDAPAIIEIAIIPANCSGDNGTATFMIDGGTPPYLYTLDGLDPSAVNQFTDLAPGDYLLSVSDSLGCTARVVITIPLDESAILPHVTVTPARCGSPSGILEIHSQGIIAEYILNGSEINTTGYFPGLAAGAHHLLIRDSDDCLLDTTIHVPALDCDIFLPNIFSPNGDGINDTFGPVSASDAEILSFEIFDRWGNTVYSCSRSLQCHWDGTSGGNVAPAGVYVYSIRVKGKDGEEKRWSGDVMVVR
jgi:gliding motility-associated-like protein